MNNVGKAGSFSGTPFSSSASQQISYTTGGSILPHTRNGSLVGYLRQVEVVSSPKHAIVVKVCSVPYQKTNYGQFLAQQMVV